MQKDTILQLKDLVGQKGLLPVRDKAGFRGEVGFAVLAIEPTPEINNDIDKVINRSKFTVGFDEGTLINDKDTGVFLGSAFSKLTCVELLSTNEDEP